jgi:hypothetical protein
MSVSLQVLISAPRAMFELILFLLLHDAVNSDEHRICCLSCETSASYGWHVSFQTISVEKLSRNKDTSLTQDDGSAAGSGTGNNSISIPGSESTSVIGSGNGLVNRRKSGVSVNSLGGTSGGGSGGGGGGNNGTGSGGGASNSNGVGGGLLGGDLFGFSKSLMVNEAVITKSKPMQRLAERITAKYLRSTVQAPDPVYKAGAKVERRIVPLSSDICMLAPTHDSLVVASATVKSVTELNNTKLSKLRRMNVEDKYHWLFVVQRSHNLEGMVEIRVRPVTFNVPKQLRFVVSYLFTKY